MPKRNPAYPPPRREVVELLRKCKQIPDDDTPRLILADWLEENGDPERAEFICVQCELVRPCSPDSRAILRNREHELRLKHASQWASPFFRAVDE